MSLFTDFKGTQRGKLPLKDSNIIVYSDGVSHKFGQLHHDKFSTNFVTKVIVLGKV